MLFCCSRRSLYLRAFAVVLWVLAGAAVVEAATVTAIWNPNPEANISGYVLHYGTQPGVYPFLLDVGNVTSRQVVVTPGRYYFALRAYNSSQQFSPFSGEVVIDIPLNSAPVLTAPPNQTTLRNSAVSLILSASDPDGDPLIFSASNLPPGLSVNSTTGMISGTLSSTLGSYTVTARASDSLQTTSVSFNWTVANTIPGPPMSLLTDRTDAEGAALMLAATASDLGGNPLTYHATRLPDAGLTGLVGSAWRIVGVNDFDGDGQSDLLWRQTQTGDVAVWLLNGITATHAPVVALGVPLAWTIAATGDLDGDSKADVVWRHTQTGDVSVWLMDGATVKALPVIATGVALAWRIDSVGDLDDDGKVDLVWRHTQTGDVSVWLMDGATAKAGPVIASGVPLAWRIDGVGDLDGDGKADLIWRNTQNGDLAGWLMDGASVRQGPVISAGGPLEWQVLGVKDVDGDEKADLIWRHMPTGNVAVWLMNGVALKRIPTVTP